MKFCEAIDKTLDAYGISAKWLSEKSGVSQQMISQYRKGKQRVYSDSLEAMITALPEEPRRHLFSLILGSRISPLSVMDEIELADLMDEIAQLIRQKTLVRTQSIRVKSPV
ncbi:MAG: hypothetical protein ACM37W_17825 [Actinomycetota bacterium]